MSRSIKGEKNNFGAFNDSLNIVGNVESFRQNVVESLRSKQSSIESGFSNSNSFDEICLFSRLSGEKGKSVQLLAASMILGGKRYEEEILSALDPEAREKVKKYKQTVSSRRDQFFPEGDASYHSSSDKLVFHRLSSDILNSSLDMETSKLLEPLVNHLMIPQDGEKHIRDIIVHEGTHSWLMKNSRKSGSGNSEEIRAAEESFCYLAGYIESGINPSQENLVESKVPDKRRTVWATQLMAEKVQQEGLGVDWARTTAKQMYDAVSNGRDPFLFIFENALMKRQKKLFERYRSILENQVSPVFGKFSQLVKDVEEESLDEGGKMAYQRAKQIEEQVEWHEPENALTDFRKSVFLKAVEKSADHNHINKIVFSEMEKEAEKLGEYSNMVSKLEDSVGSRELRQEAEEVEEDLYNVGRNIAAAD